MTMTVIAVIVVRIIIMLVNKEKLRENEVTINVTNVGDGFHPAEFELREHFTMRCSE